MTEPILDALEEIADQTTVRVNVRTKQGKRDWSIGAGTHGSPAREKPAKPPERAPIAAAAPPVDSQSDPILEFASYEAMREAFRAFRVLRGLSNSRSDELANLGEGHTDKILGPTGRQNFGELAFNALCATYAIKFVAVRDLEQEQIMAEYWADEQRQHSHARSSTTRVSKIILERAKPHVMRESGRNGGLKRACQPSAWLANKKAGKSRMRKLSKKERVALARMGGFAKAANRRKVPNGMAIPLEEYLK